MQTMKSITMFNVCLLFEIWREFWEMLCFQKKSRPHCSLIPKLFINIIHRRIRKAKNIRKMN